MSERVSPRETLHELALDAASRAHAPYSGLRVGAALLSDSGRVHLGCNVENAAYPLSGCAERHAIAAAVQAEGSAMRIAALAVVALDADGLERPAAPCGGCRQQVLEFGTEARVSFLDAGGERIDVGIEALLPHGFRFD